MSVTQYIGARYVPIFAENEQWSNEVAYEPLTVVLHQGNSYTSKQSVPVGIDINNSDYWALTGNYNAQIEQYRQEVRAYDGRITANTGAIEAEAATRAEADTALRGAIEAEAATRAEAIEEIKTNYLPYYTPEQFGAVGDGVTDDTQAFKDMLTAIVDNSLIVLPHDNYLITDTLVFDKSFCRITGVQSSENKPALKFVLPTETSVCLLCSGTGNTFTNICIASNEQAQDRYLVYIDAKEHNYNVDYVFDSITFYNSWNGIGVVGRNLRVINCLISTIAATSIVILQPDFKTPLRGYVIQGNRFHVAGMLVNTTAITGYLETFNLELIDNMVDLSKRLYLGITDNVTIKGNVVTQTTLQDDFLILAANSLSAKQQLTVIGNSISTQGSPTSGGQGPIAGLVSCTTSVKGAISIIGNSFFTTYAAGNRALILFPSTTNKVLLNILGNVLHSCGSGTPIQVVNSSGVTGAVIGNSITTEASTNFISATGLEVANNSTGNKTF